MFAWTKKGAKLFFELIRLRCQLKHHHIETQRWQGPEDSQIKQRSPQQRRFRGLEAKPVKHPGEIGKLPGSKAEEKIRQQPPSPLRQRHNRIEVIHLQISIALAFQINNRRVNHNIALNWQSIHPSQRQINKQTWIPHVFGSIKHSQNACQYQTTSYQPYRQNQPGAYNLSGNIVP